MAAPRAEPGRDEVEMVGLVLVVRVDRDDAPAAEPAWIRHAARALSTPVPSLGDIPFRTDAKSGLAGPRPGGRRRSLKSLALRSLAAWLPLGCQDAIAKSARCGN
jgi:hypothetical protein